MRWIRASRRLSLIAAIMACASPPIWPRVALAQSDPASIVLPLYQRAGNLIPNVVAVSVGGGAPIRVTFDTGSLGLRVLESSLGPTVRRTDTRLHETYFDGTVFDGYLAYAPVSFPTRDGISVATAVEVPIQVITAVSCSAAKPRCPGMGSGRVGVMGLRYESHGKLFNPLALLPGNLGNGFIVDDTVRPSSVTVGLTPENTAGFRFASLRSDSPPLWVGNGLSHGWIMNSITACFAVDGVASPCSGILFDTGANATHVPMENAPGRGNEFLRPGQTVQIMVAGLCDYSVKVTRRARVRITNGHGNAGEHFFQVYRVAFDGQGGRIGVMPR